MHKHMYLIDLLYTYSSQLLATLSTVLLVTIRHNIIIITAVATQLLIYQEYSSYCMFINNAMIIVMYIGRH